MKNDDKYYIETGDILGVLEPSVAAGLSVEALLKTLNLAPDLLDAADGRITLADGWRIASAHQSIVKEETHLMSNRPLKPGTTRFVFSNLVHCKTLQEGMEMLADTYNIVHGGNYNFVKKRGNCLSYIVEDSDFDYRDGANNFAIEFALIKIHCALTFMIGHRINPVKLCTKRKHILPQNHHLNFFSCNTHFNHPHFELAYDIAAAPLCFRALDEIDLSEQLLEYCVRLGREEAGQVYKTELVKRVSTLITRGAQSQEDVATALGMSVATLRRKLKALGTNFRSLLDSVSGDMAVMALIQQDSVSNVAERLGYCDERSFKRAFKRWHGVSPADFVKQVRAGNVVSPSSAGIISERK